MKPISVDEMDERMAKLEKNLIISLRETLELNKRLRSAELRLYGLAAGMAGAILVAFFLTARG